MLRAVCSFCDVSALFQRLKAGETRVRLELGAQSAVAYLGPKYAVVIAEEGAEAEVELALRVE